MFSGRHSLKKFNGKVFLDRNPVIFNLVLNYLRNGLRYPDISDNETKALFKEELDFWQIEKLDTTQTEL